MTAKPNKFVEAAKRARRIHGSPSKWDKVSHEERVGLYLAAKRIIAEQASIRDVIREWHAVGGSLSESTMRKIIDGVRSGAIKPPKE